MANKIFLGLGSNVGDSENFLIKAVEEISNSEKLLQVSSIYETKPFGFENQNNFLNAVIEIESGKTLENFFIFIKTIEEKLGREERFRWGPREIDIDILLFGNLILKNDKIEIPHKDLLKRDFVFIPLIEIAPEIIHPVHKTKIAELTAGVEENYIISKRKFLINGFN